MSYDIFFYRLGEGRTVAEAHAEYMQNLASRTAVRPLPSSERDRLASAILAFQPELQRLAGEEGGLQLSGPDECPVDWCLGEWECSLSWPSSTARFAEVVRGTRPGVEILIRDGFTGYDPQAGRAVQWPGDWDSMAAAASRSPRPWWKFW